MRSPVLASLAFAVLNAIAAPAAAQRITISRDTTFIVTPLRADGTVDYAAALNTRHSAGVTPDNNAALPLRRALDGWMGREPAEALKASRAPWQESAYPAVATWLKANEKPLALALEASRRPRFWIPVTEGKDGELVDEPLPLTKFRAPDMDVEVYATRGAS